MSPWISSFYLSAFVFTEPLSSVSSLEVHFDLMDLTELTDMSDQELAEVFADSDDESQPHDSSAGQCRGGLAETNTNSDLASCLLPLDCKNEEQNQYETY